jgi:hypothetical protein
VLNQVADELAHYSPNRLHTILELLESMKAQPKFLTLFGENIAAALFAALPLNPIGPVGPCAELELLARATALCSELGQFVPQEST